jgi:tetratricopeptide (TPR) repeat protein
MRALTVPASRILVAVATALCFARALPYPLQRSWDDGRFIIDNPAVRKISLEALERAFKQVQFEAFHPLHLLSYWLDVPWFGPVPIVLHAVNLALWIAALSIVHECLLALGVRTWIALGATLACGLHPIQVEAVSWATGRKDVLALLLSAASLLAQLRARGAWDRSAWLARLWYALAILAKTTTITLPLFACLLEIGVRRVHWRAALLRQLPSFCLSLIAGGLVLQIWGEHAMLRGTLGGLEGSLLRVSQTLGSQLLTAFWPSRCSPMYPTQRVAELGWVRSCALLGYLILCGWALRSTQPRASALGRRGAGRSQRQTPAETRTAPVDGMRLMAAGLLGWLILILPASNLVPMYFPLQDRYLSLPLLGLACALAGAATALAARDERASQLLLAGIVVALALRTFQYESVWRSEERLWGHAVRTQPAADYAWLKLGEVRRDAGQLEGAIAAYQGAVRAAPLRKLSHVALFEAVALRDERPRPPEVSQARALAQRYYAQLDEPRGLSGFGVYVFGLGYLRAAELPLSAAFAQDTPADDALERAARQALAVGRPTLARFYVHAMSRAPIVEPLASLERARYFAVVP